MHIYFSGIGGTGLGPLALIARDAGHDISGSDKEATPTFLQIKKISRNVNLDQSGEYMAQLHDQKPIDWFVYSSALPKNHPELVYAKTHGINSTKRDKLLKKIISSSGQKLIAIAGTHGKTTTTAMVVWLFKQLGRPISYSIGADLTWGPSGSYDKASQYFVYECDEFDRNFLQFEPYLSLITSIDYDHADTYPTQENYRRAFDQFKSQSGQVISWNQVKSSFINLPGRHNRQNGALAVEAVGRLTNQTNHKLVGLIKAFPGVRRRFERLKPNLYSDYAHHPVEIAATLELARELAEDVVAVYQPHQNVRQHQMDYSGCFDKAEAVYWLPTYLSREDPDLPILEPKQLVQKIKHKQVTLAELDDHLAKQIKHDIKSGKLVVIMGAGSIDAWARQTFD